MPNTFFASDHHLGHTNILKFLQEDGVTPVRDFSCVDEMNEVMIGRHNSVVKDKDTCWFLGDVVINRRFLALIKRFNGRKRLILGNHDIFKNKDYYNAGFEDLHAFRKFDGFACTHIPVHPESLGRWGMNVHGHTHTNRMMRTVTIPGDYIADWNGTYQEPDETVTEIDPRYVCVCVEQINYIPISIEDLRKQF